MQEHFNVIVKYNKPVLTYFPILFHYKLKLNPFLCIFQFCLETIVIEVFLFLN